MEHLSQREVAALAQGTLPAERLDHVAECDTCAAHLDMVAAALAELPAPAMPDDVATRLDAVLADESRRRTSGAAEREDRLAQAAHAKRLSLGTFGDNSPRSALAGKVVRPRRLSLIRPRQSR